MKPSHLLGSVATAFARPGLGSTPEGSGQAGTRTWTWKPREDTSGSQRGRAARKGSEKSLDGARG